VRRTKIVATLGPATSSPEAIGKLVRAGVDVTRFNFSHGDHSMHLRNARVVRETAAEAGRNVAILQDVQGPKIRTGEVEGGTELAAGNQVVIAAGDFVGDASRLSTSYDRLAEDVKPGDRLLIDDGLLGLRVESIEDGEVVCKVIEGGPVSSHKGLNFPDSTLSIRGLTPKDVEDLRFGMEELHPDWVAMSFVRTGDEVREVKERIKEFGGNAPVISKIEKHEAIENIEDIIQASDGIMVARGDLAVELSAEWVPIEQKRMIARCRRLGKPIIVATQMLDSMIRNPRPTRAEVSDVANAVLDGADALMLSGETSVGRYPTVAVRTMARIIENTEDHGLERIAPLGTRPSTRGGAVTWAAREVGELLDVRYLVTFTQSGDSARRMSRLRSRIPVLAFTPEPAVRSQLALTWGIETFLVPAVKHTDDMVRQVDQALLSIARLAEGDMVVIVAGSPPGIPGSTNAMRVHRMGDAVKGIAPAYRS